MERRRRKLHVIPPPRRVLSAREKRSRNPPLLEMMAQEKREAWPWRKRKLEGQRGVFDIGQRVKERRRRMQGGGNFQSISMPSLGSEGERGRAQGYSRERSWSRERSRNGDQTKRGKKKRLHISFFCHGTRSAILKPGKGEKTNNNKKGTQSWTGIEITRGVRIGSQRPA